MGQAAGVGSAAVASSYGHGKLMKAQAKATKNKSAKNASATVSGGGEVDEVT